MTQAKTLTALAKALGVSQPRASTMKKQPWFPPGPPWDVEEVRELWAGNAKRAGGKVKRKKKTAPVMGDGAPSSEAHARRRTGADASRLDSDPGNQLDPIAKAEKLLEAMTDRLDKALQGGQVNRDDVEHVVKAVDTLRKAHKDYPDIQKRRGELVEREQAIREMSDLAMILLQAMERVEANVPTRLLQLIGERAWQEKTVKVQVLEVQRLLREQFDSVRRAMAEAARSAG